MVAQIFSQKPNIMVVIADDVGIDAMGSYGIGIDVASTPFLDQLSQQGIRFTSAWSNPKCTPTRAAMLTGMYGNKSGVSDVGNHLGLNKQTLFEYINVLDPSYQKGIFGKWHLGTMNNLSHPNNQGADWFDGFLSGSVGDGGYWNWPRILNGVAVGPETTYATSHITNSAISWLETQRSNNNPWLMWVAYGNAHTPLHVPPSNLHTHETSTDRGKFLAMFEAVDNEFERLYNTLTNDEKANTLVIFVGDNGTSAMVGEKPQVYPGGHWKSSVYNGGILVPMIVSGYGISRQGAVESAQVSLTDVYATVLETIGEDLNGGIHNSFSLKALLADATAPKRPFNYSEVSDLNYAISDGTYKLIKLGSNYEFYDLPNDRRERFPLDLNSLSQAALDAYQTLFDELSTQITGWSCNDGIQNGNETGIDCGGDCDSCNLSTNIHQKPNINLVYNTVSKQIKINSDFNLKGLKVFNVMGQQQTDLHLQDGILNASNLVNGLYVLRFYFEGGYTQLKKVIIY